MITSHVHSCQPLRVAWTHECLIQEQAIALGQAIDVSTWKSYGLALNSYLLFVHMHNIPVEPTAETLSLYTMYMCHHIKPDSVDTYLSGICHQLEPYFLNIHQIRKARLVHCTLEGCKQLHRTPTNQKRALTIADLNTVCSAYLHNCTHDDLLFCMQLCISFFALMCLGELTWPDDTELQDPRKLTKHSSVMINDNFFQFFLPGHKANRFFEGNIIILHTNPFTCNPMALFMAYLKSCDHRFPLSSPLWLNENGTVPTRSYFM